MSLALVIYIILFSLVISTFLVGYLLCVKFPNSKLYKFWNKYIISDIDMDEFK
jgi:hypothetical protein